MKKLNKLLLIVLIMLSASFWSWSMIPPFTGEVTDEDSVKISIADIKKANVKLIEAKANKQILIIKDSIIFNQNNIIDELENINAELQDRVVQANENINSLVQDRDKYKTRAKRASWAAIGSGSAFLVLLILIL